MKLGQLGATILLICLVVMAVLLSIAAFTVHWVFGIFITLLFIGLILVLIDITYNH